MIFYRYNPWSYYSRTTVTLLLIMLLLSYSLVITSCGKPTPTRTVEWYLEEITKPEINEDRIEQFTTERYRDKLKGNALLSEIMASGKNYFNLFAPLMTEDDYQAVQDEYDFKITYSEVVEGNIALVNVTVRPILRKGIKNPTALESGTLHPLLKQALQESMHLEFKFALRLTDEQWKIKDIIYPGILDEVKYERSAPSVTIPPPDETGPEDDAGGESGGAVDDDT
jgi:hypothetical protein